MRLFAEAAEASCGLEERRTAPIVPATPLSTSRRSLFAAADLVVSGDWAENASTATAAKKQEKTAMQAMERDWNAMVLPSNFESGGGARWHGAARRCVRVAVAPYVHSSYVLVRLEKR